jgi:hypothetical protein
MKKEAKNFNKKSQQNLGDKKSDKKQYLKKTVSEVTEDKSAAKNNTRFYEMRKKKKETADKYAKLYQEKYEKHPTDISYNDKMSYCGILKEDTKVFHRGQCVCVYDSSNRFKCKVASNDGRVDFIDESSVRRMSFSK